MGMFSRLFRKSANSEVPLSSDAISWLINSLPRIEEKSIQVNCIPPSRIIEQGFSDKDGDLIDLPRIPKPNQHLPESVHWESMIAFTRCPQLAMAHWNDEGETWSFIRTES